MGLDQSPEGSLHDPAFRQDFEALHVVPSLRDFEVNLRVPLEPGDFAHQLAGVASVGPDQFEPAISGGEDRHQQTGSVPVLHVGGSHL